MQFADAASPLEPSVHLLGPSLILDLSWCVHAASSDYLREAHPVLDRLYRDHPDLQDRVLGFWTDGGPTCFAEAEVMAHHAGAVEATDFPTFRARTEAAMASFPLDLGLESETPEDRAAILDRVAQLQRSTALRGRYFDLLADIWSEIGPWWESEGVAAIGRATVAIQRSLARGVEWHQIVNTECAALIEHMAEIVDRCEKGHPVAIAPCALFGKGLYLELPGCTLIGVGVASAVDEARARAEQVTRRLRALADPTRLAIFDYLKSGPTTVGDIAGAFSLAQPTVSIHVKRLREAGLVTSVRRGNSLEISVDGSATESLATELATLLSI
jgi:ArsR family transcriptional regulator, arsenate/arsenite/antimonite-responsive transcriptional repressor